MPHLLKALGPRLLVWFAISVIGGVLLGRAELAQLREAFETDARISHRLLSQRVVGKPDELKRLEAIVHPEVAEMRRVFLADNADAALIVFDIPLLYEKTGQHGLDAVAVVSAPAQVQRERVLARPGMTTEKFEHILKLQVPDAEKRKLADHVIDTGVSLAETRHAVQQLVHRITTEK